MKRSLFAINWIFWSLFAVEGIGAIVLICTLFSSRGWGPEGPVGGWLLFLPAVFLATLGGLALILRSPAVKAMGIAAMAIPVIGIIVGPLLTTLEHRQTERRLAGDENFVRPAQRNLAHAISAHDLAQVKNLLPGAGDLNRRYQDETFLSFAVSNSEGPSVEIVRALLEAGANPNLQTSNGSWPLTGAIYQGPELTEALLQAGADPNVLDSAGRPIWWTVLSDDTDKGVATLRTLLDHGADVRKRDGEGGPIAWAAYQASMSFSTDWRLIGLLIERGAPWQDEKEFGQSLSQMLHSSLARRGAGKEPTAEMRQIIAKIDGASKTEAEQPR